MDAPRDTSPAIATPSRRSWLAWCAWDWGSAAFNAVTVTFIFSVYLVKGVGENLESGWSPAVWLAASSAAAGLAIAVMAPISGQRADSGSGRHRAVAIWTTVTVLAMGAMFFVRAEPHFFWFGLALLAIGSIAFQFAEVAYFAMIRQVSTPQNIGRISGFGWAAGYVGGVLLLLLAYVGFIAGDGDTRGLLGITSTDGFNIRLVMVIAAIWFAVHAIPLFFFVPKHRSTTSEAKPSIAASYRKVWNDITFLWHNDRNALWFLLASAIFRDGLAGIFAYGAILAVNVYGIADADVLLFGVAANVVSAIGAASAGFLEDRVGPKRIIVISLVALLATLGVLIVVSGPTMFWVFGLVLTFFVGPAQSASRTFLARITQPGHEGQMFGLYATTGRAVSFLAPAGFALTAGLSGNDRFGSAGIALVLLAGLVLLIRVPNPVDRAIESQ